ncbi:dual-specificity RNA methyltransferase RlmN [Pycnococcus provasolii]|mmetsp:Transcript_16682/g.42690  ORF Transcript_16682/g.42690 Transcript_16682/m.42690 type:complete len:458 (-) Transcript_16682:777-2150(-)
MGQGIQGTSPASPSSRQFSGHSGQASVSLKSSKRTRLVHDDDSRVILKGLSMSELTYVLKNVAQVAQPARIAQRLFSAMYDVRAYIYRRKKQNAMPGLVASWDELEGHINAKTLDKLRRTCTLSGLVTLEDVQTSKDGTAKLVLRLDAAGKGASREELMAAGSTVEAVIIPDGAKRNTLCVSSQSGCGLNCQFCATGRLGFRGNLNACQVLEQMVIAARHVADHHADGQHNMLTNVVYMGMGEPLANLEAVKSSLEVLCEESVATFTIHANKITVSTSGLVPELNELMETTRAQLAVSLHATEDETRDWMVPVNRKYQLDELIGALERWFPKDDVGANGATNRWRSSVMIEYVLLQGINDTDEDAKRLAHMLQNVRAKVNLIQFNPHAGTIFAATSGDASARFRDMLMRSGQREVSLRVSRGDDENAACGQLAAGGSVDFAVPLSDVPARFQDAVVL